ncbi:MAG: hypothetical protein HZA48_11725 [Planctomycetes bacterium]|nr:hypothetical protein [Planctomycetota bacterium]
MNLRNFVPLRKITAVCENIMKKNYWIFETLKIVFYAGIGFYLERIFSLVWHILFNLAFGNHFIRITLNVFGPGMIFTDRHTNNPWMSFISYIGPLLINICIGIMILLFISKVVPLKLRKATMITGGVFVAQLCFQPLNIYNITGNIVYWTTSLNMLLFLRKYYWILLIPCIPLIFLSVKTYFRLLHPDVTSFSGAIKTYMLEILIPAVFFLLLLAIAIKLFPANPDKPVGIDLEGKYLYNKVFCGKTKATPIPVLTVKDTETINNIIAEKKFNDSDIVFFHDKKPLKSLNIPDNTEKFRGCVLYEGELIRMDFILRKTDNKGASKTEIVDILTFSKTVPDAPESKIPAILMFCYYCIIAFASTYRVTSNNRKKAVNSV